MENKEFFRQFSNLLLSGPRRDDILGLVFDARKVTDMNSAHGASFNMNTLSSDLVVGRTSNGKPLNIDNLAYFISERVAVDKNHIRLDNLEDKAAEKEFKKLKIADDVKDFIFAHADYFEADDKINAVVEKANEKLFDLFENFDKEYTILKTDKMKNQQNPVARFLTASLSYFEEKRCNEQQNPILPYIATAMLARSMFDENMSDKDALRAGDYIEQIMDEFIVRLTINSKRLDREGLVEEVVSHAAADTASLLWQLGNLDHDSTKRNKAPKYNMDDKYYVPEKYLHDITLIRKLSETTQNANQANASLEIGANEMSYVGLGTGVIGQLVSPFEKCKEVSEEYLGSLRAQSFRKKLSPMLSLLIAAARNDASCFRELLKGDDNNISLAEAIQSVMAVRYSGNLSKDAAQYMEAVGDVLGDYAAKDDFGRKAAKQYKQIAQNTATMLKKVRDVEIPNVKEKIERNKSSIFQKEDIAILNQIEKQLAGLEDDLKLANPTASQAQAAPVAAAPKPFVAKTASPEKKRANAIKRTQKATAEKIANMMANASLSTNGKFKITRLGADHNGTYKFVDQAELDMAVISMTLSGKDFEKKATPLAKQIREHVDNIVDTKPKNATALAQQILLTTTENEKVSKSRKAPAQTNNQDPQVD